jgi:fatty acid desaturase
MQLLRITRKSNDTQAFVALLLSFLIMIFLAVFVIAGWDTGAMPFILGAVAISIGGWCGQVAGWNHLTVSA